jgi:RNA polymerase sporulation-specific sigma factor
MKRVDIVGVDTGTLPKYSDKETAALLERIRNGDKDAREQFIFANMRLVLSAMQKYINVKHSGDDVFQVGCVGLIKAIDNFNPKFEVKFSTYAVPMIIGEIRRFMRDESGIRVSRSMRDTTYRALNASERLSKELSREPTIEEVAKEIDESVVNVFFALSATGNVSSLDDPVGDAGTNDNITLMEQLPASNKDSNNWLTDMELKNAIRNLANREREVLLMRYFDGKTQIEVSEEIGISQAQVSRLEKNALAEIKRTVE